MQNTIDQDKPLSQTAVTTFIIHASNDAHTKFVALLLALNVDPSDEEHIQLLFVDILYRETTKEIRGVVFPSCDMNDIEAVFYHSQRPSSQTSVLVVV